MVINRRHKYNAKPTVYNGVRYDSKAEAQRAEALDLLIRAGHVDFWIGQPTFRLGVPENVYRPDFLVIHGVQSDWPGVCHVEDVKGVETPAFKRNKRLWDAYGPCPLHVIRRGSTVEVIG